MRKSITKPLRVRITETERRQYGAQQAERVRDLEEVQSAKKIAAAQFSSREKELNAEISRLSHVLISGTEERQLECEIQFDFKNSVAETMRLDTCEIVDRRPLTKHEMQGRFDMDTEDGDGE